VGKTARIIAQWIADMKIISHAQPVFQQAAFNERIPHRHIRQKTVPVRYSLASRA
jgi:hypothetical protein